MSDICDDLECWCCHDRHLCEVPDEAPLGTAWLCSECSKTWTAVEPTDALVARHPNLRLTWLALPRDPRPARDERGLT